MGRPSQPLPLKILKGRSSTKDIAGRPIPQLPAFEHSAPSAPPWLDDEALAEWERVVPTLDQLGLIKAEDRALFSAYCETWSTWVAARKRIRAEGLTLTNPTSGHVSTNPAVQVAASAARDLLKLATQFGLTPLAEAGLGAPPTSDADEFDAFAGGGA